MLIDCPVEGKNFFPHLRRRNKSGLLRKKSSFFETHLREPGVGEPLRQSGLAHLGVARQDHAALLVDEAGLGHPAVADAHFFERMRIQPKTLPLCVRFFQSEFFLSLPLHSRT